MGKSAALIAILVVLFGAGLYSTATAPVAAAQQPAPAVQSPASADPGSLKVAWRALTPDQQNAAIGGIVGVLVVAALLFWLASHSDMLRDSEPRDFDGATVPAGGKPLRRPFSLAQVQMAWWFLLVLAAYLYVFAVKNEFALSAQALTLMGIGTGTALGAAMVDANKTNPTFLAFQTAVQLIAAARAANPLADTAVLEQQRDMLAQKLTSQNFLHDILTDANGISLHRFQSVIWTLVLGAIFVIETAIHRKMPEFDIYTLGVLGISNGTYLGFKIPERPT